MVANPDSKDYWIGDKKYDLNSGGVFAGQYGLFDWEWDDLGVVNVVGNTKDQFKRFVPTTISIMNSGSTVTSKGKPTYSSKIINSELTTQVDSLKNSVKEVRLLIPGNLSNTIETIEGNVTTISRDIKSKDQQNEERFANLESTNAVQTSNITNLTTRMVNVENTNSTQSSTISGLESTVGQHGTTITNLSSSISSMRNENTISSSGNSISIESGGQTLTMTAANGILTIQFGQLSWKVALK